MGIPPNMGTWNLLVDVSYARGMRTELFVKQGCFSWCLWHSQVHTGWEESLSFPSIFSSDGEEFMGAVCYPGPGECRALLDEQLIKVLISTASVSVPLPKPATAPGNHG